MTARLTQFVVCTNRCCSNFQVQVEITKIIIIKKYKCESDGWSCKGNDYCDVSAA